MGIIIGIWLQNKRSL